MNHASKARLRTRTGCLDCRQRRKKCDEHRPRCGGCCRNHLDCTWPTATTQPVDGRRRHHQAAISRLLSFPRDSPEEYYHYFATSVIPCLVRQNCLPQYTDQSYMLRLGLEFTPPMSIMVTIAAEHRENHDPFALHSYLLAIRGLPASIADATETRNEDALLATTICLCVYESFRTDSRPNVGPHASSDIAIPGTEKSTASQDI